MARLQQLYKEKIIPTLVNEFKYRNLMQVPRLEKIVVSMGVGRAVEDKKFFDGATQDLTQITGLPWLTSRVAVWIAAQVHLLFAAFVLAVP